MVFVRIHKTYLKIMTQICTVECKKPLLISEPMITARDNYICPLSTNSQLHP